MCLHAVLVLYNQHDAIIPLISFPEHLRLNLSLMLVCSFLARATDRGRKQGAFKCIEPIAHCSLLLLAQQGSCWALLTWLALCQYMINRPGHAYMVM